MAKATKTVIRPAVEALCAVDLRMTQEEAGTLCAVLAEIGGSMQGPRGTLDSIRRAVEDIGIRRAQITTQVKYGKTLYVEAASASPPADPCGCGSNHGSAP